VHVLYLHGFASGPRGAKITALRAALEPDGVTFAVPDLNVPSFERLDFETMVAAALAAAAARRPDVVVGSSLGAVVALAAARRGLRAPLVLVAPAVGFGPRWAARAPAGEQLELMHHAAGRLLPVHRAFFVQMATVAPEAEPPADAVTIITGERDESVAFPLVADVWRRWSACGALAPGSRFIPVAGGDHGLLDHVALVVEAVRRAAGV
jgi:hypothetical protein